MLFAASLALTLSI